MRNTLVILGLIFLTTVCQPKAKNLNGYYVATKYGYTVDIIDTLVLLNTDNVFEDTHDTIIIDLQNNSFVRSHSMGFPYVDFKTTQDTVILYFAPDDDTEDIKFYKSESRDKKKNYYSTSEVEICLDDCDTSCFDITNKKIQCILIGLPKHKEWGESIRIQFEDIFIDIKDISKVIVDSTVIISLHFDKSVPQYLRTQIKNETKKLKNRVVIAQFGSDRIVYRD